MPPDAWPGSSSLHDVISGAECQAGQMPEAMPLELLPNDLELLGVPEPELACLIGLEV